LYVNADVSEEAPVYIFMISTEDEGSMLIREYPTGLDVYAVYFCAAMLPSTRLHDVITNNTI
jgi:hypothetical protein